MLLQTFAFDVYLADAALKFFIVQKHLLNAES